MKVIRHGLLHPLVMLHKAVVEQHDGLGANREHAEATVPRDCAVHIYSARRCCTARFKARVQRCVETNRTDWLRRAPWGGLTVEHRYAADCVVPRRAGAALVHSLR